MAVLVDPIRVLDVLARDVRNLVGDGRAEWWMPIDLYREGDHYVVGVDLPGVDPGSIDVRVSADTLSIEAERHAPSTDGGAWLIGERPYGRFRRQITLPDGVDADRVSAAYRDGVLTLRLPLTDAAKPRRIAVRDAEERHALDVAEAA